jgi:hypothetical protein
VSSADFGVVSARLGKAQLAVDRKADFGGIGVPLAVVFPPADGAQSQCIGRLQSFVAATGTTEPGFNTIHLRIDDVAT